MLLPRVWGLWKCQISLPVGYNTALDSRLGIVGLWRQYRKAGRAICPFLICFILSIQQSISHFRPQFSSSAHEKQLRNKEIGRQALLYWRHNPQYYPQSSVLRGTVPNRKWNLTLSCSSCKGKKKWSGFFSIFILEQHEALIKQIITFCHIHLTIRLWIYNLISKLRTTSSNRTNL